MNKTAVNSTAGKARLKLAVRGAVQGVGFRPFVFRLATELGLAGWANNSPQGVFIETEGPRAALEQFRRRLEAEKPARSFIQSLEASWLDAVGFETFEIRESETGGGKTALVLPDIATCPDCLREIFDPGNRRHRYPFTNCTNCGPRFSLIEALPYDRANTAMKQFALCSACQREYDDPANRRFHAQPNACPVCGPRLELWRGGVRENAADQPRSQERGHDALLAAAHAVRAGKIVAVKGVGGFHLMADARNGKAVQLLRDRKHREEKPFALMFPTSASVKMACEVSPLEERLLCSPEAPIVLMKRIVNRKSQIVNSVAPGNPNLGVMLPSNPLHHLLMAELGFPVVATSGNLSDEPICTDECEALERLGDIADVFLVHNRPIVRQVDDSIVRVMLGREMVLRRARGLAPLPITLISQRSTLNPQPILAVGAHLKNSIALSVGNQVFISQHIGDLETEPASNAFRRVIADFEKLYDVKPQAVAADLHPDYLATKFANEMSWTAPAERSDDGALGQGKSATASAKAVSRIACHRGPKLVSVQHHIAHVLSCMAENEIGPPALGVSWDGTGYGTDGTIWGGEYFRVADREVKRIAHLRPFRLPGGDKAVREPRRPAIGLLFEIFGEAAFDMENLPPFQEMSPIELRAIKGMLRRKLNSPPTTSAGRLFDAVASLIGLRQQMRYEGQAAMELEFALDGIGTDEAYEMRIVECGVRNKTVNRNPINSELQTSNFEFVLDWAPMIEAILSDAQKGAAVGSISAKFHNALAEAVVTVAKLAGEKRVVLSGGCFQNRYLTERTVRRLEAEGFLPYWHQRVPPNDGGIALGQVVAARRELNSVAADVSPLHSITNQIRSRLTPAATTVNRKS